MKKVLGFYRTFLQTINPQSYEGFADSTAKNSFKYFFNLTLNALIVMIILMLPTIIGLPHAIENQLNHVETFNLNIDFKTSSPLMIPQKNPVVLINYANETPTHNAKIILNNNVLYAGVLFDTYQKNLTMYKDVVATKTDISKVLAFLLLLMAPTVAIIFYAYFSIKYLAIAILASFVAVFIAAILRRKIPYKKLINSAMYGISLTVFLDVIFFVFGYSYYYIQFVPLAVFVIGSIIINGDKIDPKAKNRFVEIKG
ncbi:MAG TPA: DUF1189 family protein [Candidatus Nanoarchaeia archaeon]|nr:DUF1189 family protein [Candidatus Nanoarchaeia archaeon]